MELMFGRGQKYLPVLYISILSIGVVISFVSSLLQKKISLYLPFISETGAVPPAQCLFSLFLIFGSFVGCVMKTCTFILIAAKNVERSSKLYWLNIATFLVGMNAMMGLAGVAAFPMSTVFWAHLVAAGLYFLGTAAYFIMLTILTKMNHQKIFLRARYGLCLAIIILLLLITFIFPISLKNWQSKNSVLPAMKEPHHEGFTLILISSLLEWSIVLVMIFLNLTLMKELSWGSVKIIVQENKSDLTEESDQAHQLSESHQAQEVSSHASI